MMQINKYNEGETVYFKGHPYIVMDWQKQRKGIVYKLNNGRWKMEKQLKGEWEIDAECDGR